MSKSFLPSKIPILWVVIAVVSAFVILPMAQNFLADSEAKRINDEMLKVLGGGKGTMVECDMVTKNVFGSGYLISEQSTCRVVPESCTISEALASSLNIGSHTIPAGILDDEDIDKATGLVRFMVPLTSLSEPVSVGRIVVPGSTDNKGNVLIDSYEFGDIHIGESISATYDVCIPPQDNYEIKISITRPDENGNTVTVIK